MRFSESKQRAVFQTRLGNTDPADPVWFVARAQNLSARNWKGHLKGRGTSS